MTVLRNGLYGPDDSNQCDRAFESLERLRRKTPEIDYDKELKSYREERYGTTNHAFRAAKKEAV